jgi:hypothetical protein
MDKKLSQETTKITDLQNNVRLYGIEDSTGTPTSGYIDAPDLLKYITDADGDTYIKVEETADDDIINMKSGLTSGTILKLKNGSSTEVFQVDVNGNLLNNGNYTYLKKNTTSLFLGTGITHNLSTGANNTSAGHNSGNSLTAGTNNIFYGNNAGNAIAAGLYNICIGIDSMSAGTGNRNKCIAIGHKSNNYQTANGTIIIDPHDRSDASGELSNSLIIGAATIPTTDQWLRINSKFSVNAAILTNQVLGDIQAGNSLILPEITTPTADTNFGKVYTKTDNKLYFQDGAGVEHEIAFV